MFTKRQVRATLFLSALWGGIHSILSVLWGAWAFLQWDSQSWAALPGWLTTLAIHGGRAGILAGFAFALLLYRFERSRSDGNLSTPRVAVSGVLSSLPAYFIAEGMLPVLLRGEAPIHVLIEPFPYFATVGLLAALTTMAFSRKASGRDNQPPLEPAPETQRLSTGSWRERLWPRRFRAHADPRVPIGLAAFQA